MQTSTGVVLGVSDIAVVLAPELQTLLQQR